MRSRKHFNSSAERKGRDLELLNLDEDLGGGLSGGAKWSGFAGIGPSDQRQLLLPVGGRGRRARTVKARVDGGALLGREHTCEGAHLPQHARALARIHQLRAELFEGKGEQLFPSQSVLGVDGPALLPRARALACTIDEGGVAPERLSDRPMESNAALFYLLVGPHVSQCTTSRGSPKRSSVDSGGSISDNLENSVAFFSCVRKQRKFLGIFGDPVIKTAGDRAIDEITGDTLPIKVGEKKTILLMSDATVSDLDFDED